MMNEQDHHVATAREALAAGELVHAGEHVVRALEAAPHDPAMHQLFDEAFARSNDPLTEVYPLAKNTSAAAAAGHARALARLGRTDEALQLLCQIAQVSPVPYLEWSNAWPLPERGALIPCFGALLDRTTPESAGAAQRSFVARAIERYQGDGEILTFASIVSRRALDYPAAIQLAHASLATGETRLGLTTLGQACRQAGDWAGAEDAWRRSAALSPEDQFLWLDWGDACLDRGDFDAADDRYRQALARDPSNEWATGSLPLVAYRRNPTAKAWTELRAWTLANPGNERARNAMHGHTPWAGWLPSPSEALYNIWQKLRETDATGAKVTLSHLEGPSVNYALGLNAADLALTIEAFPQPDLRTPLIEGAMPLWTWDGAAPSPALPPSPDHLAWLVYELARQPFDAPGWLARARQLVADRPIEDIPGLLGCAVNPLAPPADLGPMDPLAWFWRMQHATAFLLAGFPTESAGAPNIAGLDAMLSVRLDWTASAALAAMLALVEDTPAVRNHVWGRCYQILGAGPDGGDFPTARPAYWGLLRLDPLDQAGIRHQACDWLDG